MMLALAILVSILWVTGTPYRSYFDGAQFVHFLLGPATVALAMGLNGLVTAMLLPPVRHRSMDQELASQFNGPVTVRNAPNNASI